jgi:hypothetical protein
MACAIINALPEDWSVLKLTLWFCDQITPDMVASKVQAEWSRIKGDAVVKGEALRVQG